MARRNNIKSRSKIALITGAGKRLGSDLARCLHQANFKVVIHYHTSKNSAENLCAELNNVRKHSAITLSADLRATAGLAELVQKAIDAWGRLDFLINNASSYFPTPMGTATETQWDDLMASNLKAPFFLAQAAAPHLVKTRGSIINIVDIYGEKPMREYPIYCVAKAGLAMLTKTLAKELAPKIRVNAIAPGPIVWPNHEQVIDAKLQAKLIKLTLMRRLATPDDICKAVMFFLDADYITGQIITVDGGRMV